MRTFSKFHRWIRLRKNVFLRSDWAGRCLICWWAVELCVGPNFWQTVRPCIFRVGTVLCPMCFWERSIVFARGWLICFCIANILAWLHHWCRLPWHFVGTESSWLGDQSRSWIVQWFYTIRGDSSAGTSWLGTRQEKATGWCPDTIKQHRPGPDKACERRQSALGSLAARHGVI